MSNDFSYFQAQCKRMGKQLPFIIIVSLVMTLGLFVIGWAFLNNSGKSGSKDTSVVNIALVGNPDQSYLGIGVVALTQLDSSSYAINYLTMDSEKEAKTALARGEITAYVLVPDGYVEAMSHGENMPLTYASCNDNFGLGAVLTKELVLTISEIILESQTSIYAAGKVASVYQGKKAFGPATDQLFVYEIDAILNREHLFEINNIGLTRGLGVVSYYGLALITLILMLFATSCAGFFAGRSMPLCKLLQSKGTGALKQVLAEYGVYFLSMVMTMLVLSPVMQLVVTYFELEVPSILPLLLQLVPGMLVVSAFSFLLYELTSNLVAGVFLQFVSTVVLAFVSGCFYPVSFLPKALQLIGRFTPCGVVMDYGSAVILGENVAAQLLGLLGLTAVFLGLSTYCRRLRLQL